MNGSRSASSSNKEKEQVDGCSQDVLVKKWSKSEATRIASVVSYLMKENRVEDAERVVRANANIVRFLPAKYQDNKRLMLAAMGKMPSAVRFASPRLRSDIEFLIEGINAFCGTAQFSVVAVPDTLFLLEWLRRRHDCLHLVTTRDAFSRLSSSVQTSESDVTFARKLVDLCEGSYWVQVGKDACVAYLQKACPGFLSGTYELASEWAMENRRQEMLAARHAKNPGRRE
jgi:hypothetical protein